MKIALINFNDQFWFDTACQLADKGIELPLIITNINHKYEDDERFTHSTVINQTIFQYPEKIKQLEDNGLCLSYDLVKRMQTTENLFLTISDRFCYYPISIQARKKLYYNLLKHLYSLVLSNPVDALIFESTPHMGFDNILYAIAQDLKIQTLYIQRTSINDRIMLIDHYQKINKVTPNFLNGKSSDEIIANIDEDLFKTTFKPSVWIDRSKKINREVIGSSNKLHETSTFLKNMFSRKLPAAIKFIGTIPDSSAFILNGGRQNLIKRMQTIASSIINLRLQQLKQYYQRSCSQPDLSVPYVYFSLHFQPERSTLPEGGIFENQLLALDILAKSIPTDWQIYVKEHPRQFQTLDPRKQHFRQISDYQAMQKYPNVRLIDTAFDSHKLMNRAILTATTTGSAGWESLLQNKPCVVFGTPWYAGCRSCFYVNSPEGCQSALKEISKQDNETVRINVLKFIAQIQKEVVISSNAYEFARMSQYSYDELVSNLADAIIGKTKKL